VQNRLPDPDRRVAVDPVEGQVIRDLVRRPGGHIGQAQGIRIAAGQRQGALVDVDAEHARTR
jgi:hypothetical protein